MYPAVQEQPGAASEPQPQPFKPPQRQTQPDAVVSRWLAKIDAAEKAMKPWRAYVLRTQKILGIERQTGEPSAQKTRKLNIAWANVEILKPSTFARAPKCVVATRYELPSGTQRELLNNAAITLEKAVNTNADRANTFDQLIKVRDDFVQYARGAAWKRYVPTFADVQMDGVINEDGSPATRQRLIDERVVTEWVAWDKFGHGFARTWTEVPFVYRICDMTKAMVTERWDEETAEKLTYGPSTRRDMDYQKEPTETAEVIEIWDKEGGQCLWISRQVHQPLEVGEPPLELQGFFPTPRPAFGTLLDRTLVPKPDIIFYEDQLREINDLTKRIGALQSALKVKGFYAAGATSEGAKAIESAILASDDRAIMVPVPGWAAAADKKDLGVMWLPMETIVTVIRECIATRKELIQNVFEITGISDIMRGTSEASETLGAQQLKTQFGSVRVREKQAEMARYARDSCAIDAEIIAEHFEPQTISQLTGMAIDPRVMQLLRDDKLRSFAIDVETDSTIIADEQAEKAARIELVKVVGEYVTTIMPTIQAMPALAPMAGEMLKFLLQPFRVGRQLDQAIDQAIGAAMQQLQQAAAQPKPDPEMAKLQIQRQGDQEKLAFEQQKHADMITAQRQDDMASTQVEMAKIELERERMAHEREGRAIEAAAKTAADQRQRELEDRDFGIREAESTHKRRLDDIASGQQQAPQVESLVQTLGPALQQIGDGMRAQAQAMEQLAQAAMAETELVRSPDGKPIGTRKKPPQATVN